MDVMVAFWSRSISAVLLINTLVVIAKEADETCTFLGNSHNPKGAVIGYVGAPTETEPKVNALQAELSSSVCPCFHHEVDEEDQEHCRLRDYNPTEPLLPCSFLPQEFIECDLPFDHLGNATARDELGKLLK